MESREQEPIEYASPPLKRSLTWPLIVIVLLTMLGFGMVVVAFVFTFGLRPVGSATAARRKATAADISNLSAAIEAFDIDVGRYPTTVEGLDALVHHPPGAAGWSQYVLSVPTDKWGRAYRYEFPSAKDPRTFEITSAGEDGVFGTGDDLNRGTRP